MMRCIHEALELAGKALIVALAFLGCIWLIVDLALRLAGI